jgi:hypothetical protein
MPAPPRNTSNSTVAAAVSLSQGENGVAHSSEAFGRGFDGVGTGAVEFSMNVRNVNFLDEALMDPVTQIIKTVVAAEAGNGVMSHHVHVLLAKDSTVNVQVSHLVDSVAVQAKLASSKTLARRILAQLNVLEDIDLYSRGVISVSGIAPPQVKTKTR